MRRRRGSPLLRAAAVGTGAYMAGSSAAKKSAAQAQQEAAQNAQIAELQQQAAQAPLPGPQGGQPGAPVSPEKDPIVLLKQLGELKAAGVLTEEEFEAKKAELLKQI